MDNVSLVKLELSGRIELIKLFAISSDIKILSVNKSSVKRFICFDIEMDNRIYHFHFLIKNITNSGWKDKSYIKRIQVASLKGSGLLPNKNSTFSCLIGIAFANDKPIICVWNPFRYAFHDTNRSCYILDSTLLEVSKDKGFCETIDCKKKVYLCDQYHFKELLETYIQKNRVD